MASIQGIYVALFGRPADPLGLNYYNEETNNGANLTAIGDLAGTAEYQDRFEGQNNVQIVNSIYQSLFNRSADAAGLAYFVAELQSGRQNINTIAINILDGAQGDDLTTVNNKITAANAFTAALDTGEEIAGYAGAGAAEQGRLFLQPVTSDTATIPDADAVAAAVAAAVDAGGNTPGATFTLTNGVDFADTTSSLRNGVAGEDPGIPTDFRFTSGNEVVEGSNTSLTAADTLRDGSTSDDDRLVIALAAGTALGVVVNIENIEVNAATTAAATLDLNGGVAGTNGSKLLDLDGSLGGLLTIQDIVGTGITTVDGSGLLSDVNGFSVTYASSTGTEALTLIGSSGADVIVGGNGADTITGGTGNDQLTGGAGADNIDGGAGNDTINGGSGNDILKGGAGTDTINGDAGDDNIDGGDGIDTINGGAGNDTILGGAGNDIINAGAGADIVQGQGGDDAITLTVDATSDTVVFEATASDNGNDTIANFLGNGSGADKLDFAAFIGEDGIVSFVADGDAEAATNFNAADSDILVLQVAADIDNIAWVANQKAVVISGDDVFYVTTNELAEYTSTQVATLTGITGFADLRDASFV